MGETGDLSLSSGESLRRASDPAERPASMPVGGVRSEKRKKNVGRRKKEILPSHCIEDGLHRGKGDERALGRGEIGYFTAVQSLISSDEQKKESRKDRASGEVPCNRAV